MIENLDNVREHFLRAGSMFFCRKGPRRLIWIKNQLTE